MLSRKEVKMMKERMKSHNIPTVRKKKAALNMRMLQSGSISDKLHVYYPPVHLQEL